MPAIMRPRPACCTPLMSVQPASWLATSVSPPITTRAMPECLSSFFIVVLVFMPAACTADDRAAWFLPLCKDNAFCRKAACRQPNYFLLPPCGLAVEACRRPEKGNGHACVFSLQMLRRPVRVCVPARKTVRPAIQGGPFRLAKQAVSRCSLATFASRWLPKGCVMASRS